MEGPRIPPSLERAIGNLGVWATCLPVLRELNRRDIPMIVSRSLPQVEELYGEAGGRPSSDVDLIVPDSRMLETINAVSELGWTPLSPVPFTGLPSPYTPERVARQRAWAFRPAPPATASIDIHSDRMPQHFRPSLDPGLWARAREVEQDGVHFFLMSPEDRLLLLCWHFLADFLQPEKLRDVRLVLEHGDTLRWDEVGRRAEEQGLTVTLHLVCALAAGGMERPLPAAWLQAVPPAARLRLRILLSLLRRVRGRVTILAHPFLMIAAYDRWPAMLPRLREAFLPSRFDVAYTYLGHWPSMREYLLTLARIYLQGTAKQIARYRRARSS